MADPEYPHTVSVSRDALRADLAEMELRLRNWITGELATKANASDVTKLAESTASMSRSLLNGEFTRAQENAIDKRVEKKINDKVDSSWTSRERRIAVTMMLITLASCVATVALAFHAFGHPFA